MTARLRTALLAATFFGVLTGAAAADPAMVVTDSNLRTGPGTQYPIVVTVPGGVSVDVQGCDGNWCVARYAGYEGYISQSLIAAGGAPGPAIATAPYEEYYEPYEYGYGYGPTYLPNYGHGYQRGHRRAVRPDQNSLRGNWPGNRGNWQSNRGNWQGRQGGVRSGGIVRGGGTGANVRGGGGARGGFSGGSSGGGAGGGAGGGGAAPLSR
jgi:uncharacterized protein YraI